MIGRILVLAVLLCAGAGSTFGAPTLDESWQQCADDNPDISIGGCTATIQSGQLDNEDLAVEFYNRGIAYRDKGDYDRAIADYTQAIRLKPDYAKAFNNRGLAYYNKGDYDRAIADYTQAIRLKPDDADAFFNRGSAYDAKGDHDRAIADFTQ
ncbi:MAG: tetratricopeptide repeat protein, partial [Alphaproteobacteria bacterium]